MGEIGYPVLMKASPHLIKCESELLFKRDYIKLQPHVHTYFLYQRCIHRAIPFNTFIYMDYSYLYPSVLREGLVQQVEQRHGVLATGDCNSEDVWFFFF